MPGCIVVHLKGGDIGEKLKLLTQIIMKKKTFCAISFLTIFFSLSAQTEIGNLIYDFNEVTKEATVINVKDVSVTTIDVPATVDNKGTAYKVTKIGESAFAKAVSITEATLGSNLAYIDNGVFTKCTKLTKIVAEGKEAPVIEAATFVSTQFPKVTVMVPDGCWEKYQIAWNRFHNVYENGYTDLISGGINYKVVSPTDRLLKVVAGTTAYSGDMAVPEKVTVDGKDYKVVELGFKSFFGAKTMTSLLIPSTVVILNESSVEGCTGLENITLPSSLKCLGVRVFYGCSGITSITVPEGVIKMEGNFMAKCTSLKEAFLPESLTVIGASAFSGCSSLENVKLGSKVTELLSGVFIDCKSIKDLQLPKTITKMGDSALKGCAGLDKIVLPPNITFINNAMLMSCSSLKTLEIPEGVTDYGMRAFEGCTSLETIKLSKTAKTFGFQIFSGCSRLNHVVLPDSLKALDGKTFLNCTSLTDVTFPKTLEKLANYEFQGCTSLTEITIPNTVTATGSGLFSKCTALKKFEFPKSVKTIGSTSFQGCTALESVILPPEITQLPLSVFADCKTLKTLEIPEGVTSIGNTAFKGSGLTGIVLPAGVVSFGKNIIQDCTDLVHLTCKNLKPATLTETTFTQDNYSKVKLFVPKESINAYKETDFWKNFIYIGGVEPGQDGGVDDITDEIPTATEYYNLEGIKISDPRSYGNGILVRIDRYASGKTVRKLVVNK